MISGYLYFLYSVKVIPVPRKPVVKRTPFLPNVIFNIFEMKEIDIPFLLTFNNKKRERRKRRQKRI